MKVKVLLPKFTCTSILYIAYIVYCEVLLSLTLCSTIASELQSRHERARISCESVRAEGDERLLELLQQSLNLTTTRDQLLLGLNSTLLASGRIESLLTVHWRALTTNNFVMMS